MTHRLSQTVVLTMLVAGIGMTAHAQNLERSALEAGQRFDLTAQLQLDKTTTHVSVDPAGTLKQAALGAKLNLTPSTKAGTLNKEVPAPAPRKPDEVPGWVQPVANLIVMGAVVALIGGFFALLASAPILPAVGAMVAGAVVILAIAGLSSGSGGRR